MPRVLLHLEGAVLFAAGTAVFFRLGQPWWLYLLLLAAPDLSLLALAAGPKLGSVVYNLAHTMVWPLIILVAGWWFGSATAVAVGLVWLAHLGMDRMLGIGLRYDDGRKATHLQRV